MDRCWTAQRLARRGLQHHPRCLFATRCLRPCIISSSSRQVWHEVLARLRMTC
jgi:hypothetical protein